MSSHSGKYPVAIRGIRSFPQNLHANRASRRHYVVDYLQEMFVFRQMLITFDKLVLEVKEETESLYLFPLFLAHH